MNEELNTQIKLLHAEYCRLSGLSAPLTMARIFSWEKWIMEEFKIEDLRLVIAMLRSKINKGYRRINCLRFSGLIQNTEWFGEDLAEARALSRRPVVNQSKAMVLRTTGRDPEPQTSTAMSVGQIMAERTKLAEMLRGFKQSL